MVYVLSKSGKPLMPTQRHGHVRKLLKANKAKIVRRCPFTIQLTYESSQYVQPVDLGVDCGSRHIGLSACSDQKELFSAEVLPRDDIKKLLDARRQLRRSRRIRKTRYRKPRFQNRKHSKPDGWLAPSVRAKAETHVAVIKKVLSILPVSSITLEMAPFDSQLLKAQIAGEPIPSGEDYQHGESEGFDNIKAYVKYRDGYKCAVCGKTHVYLQIHHKVQRKDGGTNTPSNLITVCEDCHKAYHAGTLNSKRAHLMDPGDKTKRRGLKDAAFMSIMRWEVWDKVKAIGIPCHMTFGYFTARQREAYNVEKTHTSDARCISGHGNLKALEESYLVRKVRCHNRQIHKLTINKGGKRKNNQAHYLVKGFRLFDKVRYQGKECFIFGRRSSGSMDIRHLDGTKVKAGIGYKHLKLLEPRRSYLIERRNALPPTAEAVGFCA